MRITKNQGFTLVELMIVIAIIGILARIALPGYTSYIARGKIVEAGVGLSSYRTSMEQYYQDQRSYAVSGSPTVCGIPPASSVSTYFTYSCVVTGAGATQGFVATASSVAGKALGGLGAYAYTIDDNNAKTTTMFAGAAASSPTGTNCWIMKKGQSC